MDQVAGDVENSRLSEHTLHVWIFELPPQKQQELHRQLLQGNNQDIGLSVRRTYPSHHELVGVCCLGHCEDA